MNTTTFKKGVGAICIGGLAITAILLYQASRKAREENTALQQQLAALAADNEALSNRLQRTGPVTPSDDQARELLRLRGEVTQLREQTNALAKVKEENRRLQATAKINADAAAILQFKTNAIYMANIGKQLGLGMRMWANDNHDVFPTNYASLSNILPNLPPTVTEDFRIGKRGNHRSNLPGGYYS